MLPYPSVAARSKESEMLDDERMPAADVENSLKYITVVNRCFGGSRVILRFFEKVMKESEATVLDLGCGSGDILHALSGWALKKGKRLTLTGIDINPHCLAFANRRYASDRVRFFRHSAFDIDRLGSFDYIISSMFFHHLAESDIVRLLKIMRAGSRKGFIVNDLYRSQPAYWAAALTSLCSGQKIVYNDAKLSVLKAFREDDFERYRAVSDLPGLEIQKHAFFRMSLSHVCPK